MASAFAFGGTPPGARRATSNAAPAAAWTPQQPLSGAPPPQPAQPASGFAAFSFLTGRATRGAETVGAGRGSRNGSPGSAARGQSTAAGRGRGASGSSIRRGQPGAGRGSPSGAIGSGNRPPYAAAGRVVDFTPAAQATPPTGAFVARDARRGNGGRAPFGNRSTVFSAQGVKANQGFVATPAAANTLADVGDMNDADMDEDMAWGAQQTAIAAVNPATGLKHRLGAATSSAISGRSALQRADRFTSGPQDNKYLEMKEGREALREAYIRAGKMPDPTAKRALSEAIQFVGECEDMCPEFERHEREYQKGLHDFEKIEGTDRADHVRCVKRYRRSAAGDPVPMPCDVRPPRVLVDTLDYLFLTIIPAKTLELAQPFVRDRCRSIRNDFTLQNYRGIEAVECHERIARFHILSAFKFCNHAGVACPNEAEFQAYYILSHIFQNDVVSAAEKLRAEVYDHPLVQLSIELQQLVQCATDTSTRSFRPVKSPGSLNFYTRFFRLCLSDQTPYLMSCLLHQVFRDVRRAALRGMHQSYYNLPPHFAVADLVTILGFDDVDEALETLEYHGIRCEQKSDGSFVAMIGRQPVGRSVQKQTFEAPATVVAPPDPSPPAAESREVLAVFDNLVAAEVRAVVCDCLSLDVLSRRALNSIVQEVVESLCEEVCGDVFWAILETERLAEELAARNLRRAVMEVWLRAARRRAELRQRRMRERQERAARFYLSVLSSEIAPPQPGSVSNWRDAKASMAPIVTLESTLIDLLTNIDPSHFQPLDVPSVVFPALNQADANYLAELPPRPQSEAAARTHLYWKLVVCTPPLEDTAIGRGADLLSRFAAIWTRSKFGHEKGLEFSSAVQDPAVLTDSDEDNTAEALLRTSVDMHDVVGGRDSRQVRHGRHVRKTFSLYVDALNVRSAPKYPVKHNSSALASGVSAAVFQFSFAFGDNHSEWWEQERLRLYSFLSSLPSRCGVPLVLLFWSSPWGSMDFETFRQQAPELLNAESFLVTSGGPISAVDAVELRAFDEDGDGERGVAIRTDEAHASLQASLTWLAGWTPRMPVARCTILRELSNFGIHDVVDFIFRKMEELCSSLEFGLDLRANSETFDAIVDIINMLTRVVSETLSSEASRQMAWPAREFAHPADRFLPPVDWNAPETHQYVARSLDRLCLPRMSVLVPDPEAAAGQPGSSYFGVASATQHVNAADRVRAVRGMYEAYVGRLSAGAAGCAPALGGSTLLTSLWARLAPFERAAAAAGSGGNVDGVAAPVVFPFARVAACFAAHVAECLDSELERLAATAAGGPAAAA
ncbi:hypothetical protein HK405_004283, partial [Cladochytrium tenue]